jgi:pimeloyl-ACP methyl ester carboxylesterase
MMSNVEEFDVVVRSHRLHVQRFGSPQDRLLLGVHGLTLNMKMFDFIGERIGCDGLQLVAVDLRGRGQSDVTPPGTYGWENHALDLFALADALGHSAFSIIGQSMGASVAMKAAELAADRLESLILVDALGRVDRGVGVAVASLVSQLDTVYDSPSLYLESIKASGLIEPWNEYWTQCYLYNLAETSDGLRARGDAAAISEDRAYGLTQDPYTRWAYLTMPTLVLRANAELLPGSGYAIPADDLDPFRRDVPRGFVVEITANHLTINVHPATPGVIASFLASVA